MEAAEALGKIAEANPGSTEILKAVPPLIKALKDENWNVRREAAEALGEIGVNKEQLETIIEMLKNGKRWEERHGAAMALGCLEDIRAVPALIAALKDKNEDVGREAAGALGKIGEANPGSTEILKAVPALINALKDENKNMRERAAEALGEIVENFVNKKLEEKDYKAALSMIENTTNMILKMYRAEFRKKGKDWYLVKERRELIDKFNSLTIRIKEKVELSNPLNEKEPMEWKEVKRKLGADPKANKNLLVGRQTEPVAN